MKKPESEGEYTTTSPQMLSSDRDQNQAETTAMLGGGSINLKTLGQIKTDDQAGISYKPKPKKREKGRKMGGVY